MQQLVKFIPRHLVEGKIDFFQRAFHGSLPTLQNTRLMPIFYPVNDQSLANFSSGDAT